MKDSDSSRKRRFSVGTKPARKMLMPSLSLFVLGFGVGGGWVEVGWGLGGLGRRVW